MGARVPPNRVRNKQRYVGAMKRSLSEYAESSAAAALADEQRVPLMKAAAAGPVLSYGTGGQVETISPGLVFSGKTRSRLEDEDLSPKATKGPSRWMRVLSNGLLDE